MTFATSPSELPVATHLAQGALHRVLLIDDRPLIRDCVAEALEQEGNLAVRALDSARGSLLESLEGAPFAAVILSAKLDGVAAAELIRWVRQGNHSTGVLVYGLPEGEAGLALRMVEAGAGALVSGESSLEELRIALQGLLLGEARCNPRLMHDLFTQLSLRARRDGDAPSREAILSLRELEVLRLVADGLRNKEICRKLFISLHTVKNHVHRILTKLEVRSRHEAVRRGKQAGWI